MKKENYEFVRYITNDNDARWADADEIKNASTIMQVNIEDDNYPGCGIPIISDGSTAYVDNSDTHTLIFGSTGSKKTRLFGMPLINFFAMADESFIAMDPKGELYSKTSGLVTAKGYKTIVLNFRDLNKSDFWNPLMLPYLMYHNGNSDAAVLLLNDFIKTLAEPQKFSASDVYFIELGCSMALAYLLFFIDTSTPEEVNIYNFINFISTKSTPQAAEELSKSVAEGSIAYLNLKSILSNKNAEKTFANVASTVFAMFNIFIVQKTLCQILSKSSFDVQNIGNEKTAIYIMVPDEKTTLHFLVTVFIKQTYEALIYGAQQMDGQKLPLRLNFILDEFGNIPAIPDMASMITAARSRNMRFFLMVQGMHQIKSKYKEDADTIKGNCDNWIFLTSREYDLLKEISDLCGEYFYTDFDGSVNSKPLISVSELQRLRKEYGETLILHGRNYPFVTELPDIDEYNFKTYKPVYIQEKHLQNIQKYDADSIISEIKNQKRPLPFSIEVFGRYKYYDFKKGRKNEDF
jgi:type IV secretion system protein VirD4